MSRSRTPSNIADGHGSCNSAAEGARCKEASVGEPERVSLEFVINLRGIATGST